MYAELHAISNFTFLRGASHPEELVERAAELGYAALALTDECSVAGVVRAHARIKDKKLPLKLIVGSEITVQAEGSGMHAHEELRIVVLPMDRRGYGNLCRLITRGRRAAAKGSYRLVREDLTDCLDRCVVLWRPGPEPHLADGAWLKALCPERLWITAELLSEGNDRERLRHLSAVSERLGIPLVASGDVHMHVRERRMLQDTLTAIRLTVPVAAAGYALQASGERHLRPLEVLGKRYPPAVLDETLRIAERCRFSLDELRYEYPEELVPEGHTATSWLREMTERGARERWPEGVSGKVRDLIEHELELIAHLKYEAFFLTVHELVSFAKEKKILCQGRGSAANSAVCFCLGVTSVDPRTQEVLFERFLSKERDEPPDIDVDFEHERREEVIQHIYTKYGRHRAALAATLVTYHRRSAMRDVGKALGLDVLQVERLLSAFKRREAGDPLRVAAWVREAGFDPDSKVIQQFLSLVDSLKRFPRHLSQHVGGFVISRGPLDELVPIENATMDNRTVIQWDKDDLESLGLLKVDVLALGMLTVLRKAFDLHQAWHGGERLTLAANKPTDPQVYEMIQRADTIGVFQIESRAQRSMLPRLRPVEFYDLVVQIAIVRPGPIQGDMVHPYLRRRDKLEPVDYPSDAVRGVLARTLGVPIFQEQVMKLAEVAAGFTAGEADQLRRSMASWQKRGTLEPFQKKLRDGMREKGYSDEFAQRICRQIEGFGEYGFPESHSCSFALLAYNSSWLKHYHPAIFTCALLNSQPMGFYAPAQLIRDARNHDVEVRAIDVRYSAWDCRLEQAQVKAPAAVDKKLPPGKQAPALRLGFRLVKGLSANGAARIVAARLRRLFVDIHDLAERAQLNQADLGALAAANALHGLTGNRHRAAWEVAGVEPARPLLSNTQPAEGIPMLRPPTEGQTIKADYRAFGLTLGRHPLALLRHRLQARHVITAAGLRQAENGSRVRVAGLVIGRQSPGTASGVTFVTVEDDTGETNAVVWAQVAERHRRAFLESQLLEIQGRLQREGQVIHLVAERLIDHSRWLGELSVRSRDFH